MNATALKKKVSDIISKSTASPFLFIGSGMSQRYVKAPNWPDLLEWAAGLAHLNYSRLSQDANRTEEDRNLRLAYIGSKIDNAFTDIWWEEDQYKDERESLIANNSVPDSPLKLQICKHLSQLSKSPFPDKYEEEIELFSKSNIDGIITTNYDSLIESRIRQDFTAYPDQDAILFQRRHAVGEIYKIHGSTEKSDSLVLTKDDYKKYNDKNSYIASKLITIFIEHPIIFLGYGLGDDNVQTLLASITRFLDEGQLARLGERLIFVDFDDEIHAPQVSPFVKQVQDRSIQMTQIKASDYRPIFQALIEHPRKYNARVVRQIKDKIYHLVKDNDPQDQLYVVDIEDMDDYEDVEVVVGVGVRQKLARRGLKGIKIDELFRDLVTGGSEFNKIADEVVTVTIRDWLSGNRRYTPLFKYLHYGELLNNDKTPDKDQLQPNIMRVANLSRSTFEYTGLKNPERYREMSISDVLAEVEGDSVKATRYLSYVSDPDPNELEGFLRDNIGLLNESNGATDYKKLACIYDRVKFGNILTTN